MSKRKKKEEEEEYEFEFPEFDREEYMENEIEKGKSILVSVAIAPLFSYIAFQLYIAIGDWTVGLLSAVFGLMLLGIVFDQLGIDIDNFGKKEWLTNGAMFMFTWLAIWVMLMNPPFSDFAHPTVDDMDVHIQEDGRWVEIDEANFTADQYLTNITVKVTDNVEVKEGSIKLRFQNREMDGEPFSMTKVPDTKHRYKTMLNLTTGTYNLKFTMEDVNGNEGSHTEQITMARS